MITPWSPGHGAHGSAASLALVLAAGDLSSIVLGPSGAAIADRVDIRKLLGDSGLSGLLFGAGAPAANARKWIVPA
jgi:hypothetical protein